MRNNKIESIDKNAFLNLNLLNTLELDSNMLKFISPDVYCGLKSLKYFSLKFNRFESLEIFNFSKNFLSLDLSNNFLKVLRNKDIEKLEKIEALDLSLNRLQYIDTNLRKFGSMKKLILSGVNLNSLGQINFTQFPNLEELDLSNNNITWSSSESYLNLRRLKVLNLENTSLIEVDILEDLKDLTEIFLSNNKILLKAEIFETLKNLKTLELRNADLKVFSFEFLTINLEKLDLSNNVISRLLSEFYKLKNLKDINLSFNQLRSFPDINCSHVPKTSADICIFENFKYLLDLKLRYSMTGALQNKKFYFNGKLKNVDLSGNNFLRFPKFCSDYIDTRECSLKSVDFSFNNLYFFYSDNLNYAYSLEYLNLEANFIKSIDSDAFFSLFYLETLILSQNNLKRLNNSRIFDHLTNVRYINLSLNIIERIEQNTFFNLKKLDSIDLSGNRISLIEKNSFYNLTNLLRLNLKQNISILIEQNAFIGFESIRDIIISKSILTKSNLISFIT